MVCPILLFPFYGFRWGPLETFPGRHKRKWFVSKNVVVNTKTGLTSTYTTCCSRSNLLILLTKCSSGVRKTPTTSLISPPSRRSRVKFRRKRRPPPPRGEDALSRSRSQCPREMTPCVSCSAACNHSPFCSPLCYMFCHLAVSEWSPVYSM